MGCLWLSIRKSGFRYGLSLVGSRMTVWHLPSRQDDGMTTVADLK
jgi:hypothetical protein